MTCIFVCYAAMREYKYKAIGVYVLHPGLHLRQMQNVTDRAYENVGYASYITMRLDIISPRDLHLKKDRKDEIRQSRDFQV